MTNDQRPEKRDNALVDVVVKVGGGLLAHSALFDGVLAVIGDAAEERRLLIVPGGGPFADAVRRVDRQLTLSDEATHWMAVLAMDQYAHLIVSKLAGSVLVAGPGDITAALGGANLPVLAPARWLRAADPLPHTWDVTSDSIAAWVGGSLGARRLVLVKPPGSTPIDSVDTYFRRALPADVTSVTVPADHAGTLRAALRA